jgi:hypothetical protein
VNIFAFFNIAYILLIPYLTSHSLTAKNGHHVYTPGVKRFPIYLMLSVWNLQTYMQTIKPPIEQAKRGKQAAELRIFPNPARELLTVILPDHLTTGQLELYDMQGRQILQRTLVSQRSEVRLPGVQGVYIVMIYTSDSNLLHRQLLVIQ